MLLNMYFFFSSRRRHTRFDCDWSSDVCSSDLVLAFLFQSRAYSDACLPIVVMHGTRKVVINVSLVLSHIQVELSNHHLLTWLKGESHNSVRGDVPVVRPRLFTGAIRIENAKAALF